MEKLFLIDKGRPMAFCFDKIFVPEDDIKELILNNGGVVEQELHDHEHAILLSNTRYFRKTVDEYYPTMDRFSSLFITHSVESKRIVPLGAYKVSNNNGYRYNPDDVLYGRVTWKVALGHRYSMMILAQMEKQPVKFTEACEVKQETATSKLDGYSGKTDAAPLFVPYPMPSIALYKISSWKDEKKRSIEEDADDQFESQTTLDRAKRKKT